MAAKKRGLGRGLDSLLGSNTPEEVVSSEPAVGESVQQMPVDRLQRGQYQPRREISEESLKELADSIREQGIIQPLVVRSVGKNYEIIAGERRWRAAQLVGMSTVPAIVREINDQTAVALALIENIQREDLNPLDEALAIARLIKEFDLTHQEAAKAIGRSRTSVSNLLRLIELDEEVKGLLESRQIEMGHARALLALPAIQQARAAHEVVAKQLSVRATEQLVRQLLNGKETARAAPAPMDPDISRLQDDLADKLSAKVLLQHGQKGKGKLVIHYNSVDELEGILDHIK